MSELKENARLVGLTYNVIRTTHKKSLVSCSVYESLGRTWDSLEVGG